MESVEQLDWEPKAWAQTSGPGWDRTRPPTPRPPHQERAAATTAPPRPDAARKGDAARGGEVLCKLGGTGRQVLDTHTLLLTAHPRVFIEMFIEPKAYNANSGAKRARVQIPALPCTGCVALGKLMNLSVPQFSLLFYNALED